MGRRLGRKQLSSGLSPAACGVIAPSLTTRRPRKPSPQWRHFKASPFKNISPTSLCVSLASLLDVYIFALLLFFFFSFPALGERPLNLQSARRMAVRASQSPPLVQILRFGQGAAPAHTLVSGAARTHDQAHQSSARTVSHCTSAHPRARTHTRPAKRQPDF